LFAWSKRKLGDVSSTHIGEFVIRSLQRPDAPYPVYNGGTSYTGFYEKFNNEAGKIVISARGANAGFVNLVRTRFWGGNSAYSVAINDPAQYSLEFLYQLIKRNQHLFTDFQQAANIPAVSKSDVENFQVATPFMVEQTRVGGFFHVLDALIAANQRKADMIKQLKRAYLRQLFPEEGEMVPRLRFPGFTGAWEQHKLGDVVDWAKGNGLAKQALNEQQQGNEAIHYADLYKFGAVIDAVIHWSSTSEGYEVPSNSLLFPMSDVTPSGLARVSALMKRLVRAGGDTLIATAIGQVAADFLSYQINANSSRILPLVTGTTVRHISAAALSTLDIAIPSLKEQSRISAILSSFDHLITLHQRKCDQTEELKRAYLQKMFL